MDLCNLLAQEGLLPAEDAEEVRSTAVGKKRTLLREILDRGIMTAPELLELLLAQVNLPLAHLDRQEVDPDVLRLVSQDTALFYRVLPLNFVGAEPNRRLNVAIADPFCRECFDELRSTYGCPVEPTLADADELTAAINRHYGQVVTRVIPRQRRTPSQQDMATGPGEDGSGPRFLEPSTVPTHNIEDETSPSQKVQALVALLTSKGLITEEDYIKELRRLLEEEA